MKLGNQPVHRESRIKFVFPNLYHSSLFVFFQEATRLSLVSGDQASYARSIRILGDIYRKKADINVGEANLSYNIVGNFIVNHVRLLIQWYILWNSILHDPSVSFRRRRFVTRVTTVCHILYPHIQSNLKASNRI